MFSTSAFLREIPLEKHRWILCEKDKPVAAALLFLENGKVAQAPLPYTLYQGLFLDEEVMNLPSHGRSKRSLSIWAEFLPALEQRYRQLSFCLSPTLTDLRGLQWHNYGQDEKKRFRLELSYSGIINLEKFPSFDAYLSSVRNTRRQEYQKALKQGFQVEASSDAKLLSALHSKTFQRQGIELDQGSEQRVLSITENALKLNFASLFICRTKEGVPCSATLFLKHGDTAYYLFGANDPEFRKMNTGTFLMLDNLRHFLENGIKKIDMVGINSPNRGDFKTSFNAEPTPYFTAHLGF